MSGGPVLSKRRKLVAISQLHAGGRVVSGRGKATLRLEGRKELFGYFGAKPQPGSLNIILDRPILFSPGRAKVRLVDRTLLAWPARMEGQPCLILRWENCPLHVAELISPYRFQVQKGDRALLQLDVADTAPILLHRLFGWGCLWFLREARFYSDGKYRYWATKMARRFPAFMGQQII